MWSNRETPPAKWAPVQERWGRTPRLARWIERRRIKGWERQLDFYFAPGLDELSVDLANDLDGIRDALDGYRKLHDIAQGANNAGRLPYRRLRGLVRAVRPMHRLANELAAKYDLVQLRRYEHACKIAEQEIPWDEWTRENPTSSELRFRERSTGRRS